MATPLELYDYVKRGFNEGKQRATNRLLGQTLNATDPTQRQAYLRALIDTRSPRRLRTATAIPKNAQAAQEKQQQNRDRISTRLVVHRKYHTPTAPKFLQHIYYASIPSR